MWKFAPFNERLTRESLHPPPCNPPPSTPPWVDWPAVTPALEPFSHLQLAPPAADCDITATRHREKLAEADWQSTHVIGERLAEADWQSRRVKREGMCWANHSWQQHMKLGVTVAYLDWLLPQSDCHSQTTTARLSHPLYNSQTVTSTLPQPDCWSQTIRARLSQPDSMVSISRWHFSSWDPIFHLQTKFVQLRWNYPAAEEMRPL